MSTHDDRPIPAAVQADADNSLATALALNRMMDAVFARIAAPKVGHVTGMGDRPHVKWTLLPSGEYSAIDLETYDPDPESRLHVTGIGSTSAEAISDLLEQLAEVVLNDDLPPTGPDHVREMISCPRESPPEFGKSRAEMRDEEDGRDE